MRISRSAWNAYIKKLSQIQSKAADLMQSYINQHGTADSNALIAYAYSLTSHYGSAAATLACEMYDATAAAQGATVPDAEPADGYTYQETAIIVNGAKKQSESLISPAVSRMVKQAAADTTTHNAIRDGAEWAWIPNGDTCAFCLTLASRGWQRASKETLKGNHAQHIHANCDCNFCIRFDKKSSVAGYDPDALFDKYYNADGDTPTDKINSLRREIYAKNKDAINAQKRVAYAKKKDTSQNIIDIAIKTGQIKDEINVNKQKRHIEENAKKNGRSYLYGDEKNAEMLYNRLKKTGKPILDKNGNWTHKEAVENDEDIGVRRRPGANDITTKKAMIVYSKTGSHIYPR